MTYFLDPPIFHNQTAVVHTGPGQETYLPCVVSAQPEPQVTWFHNGSRLGLRELPQHKEIVVNRWALHKEIVVNRWALHKEIVVNRWALHKEIVVNRWALHKEIVVNRWALHKEIVVNRWALHKEIVVNRWALPSCCTFALHWLLS